MTGAPPIAIGLFDQNCRAQTRMDTPSLYISSQASDQFSNKIFWQWIFQAVLHSLVLYFIPMGAYQAGIIWKNGMGGDYLVIGNIVYSCVILTVCIKAFLILDSHNRFTHLAIFGSIAFWFIFLITYSYFWPIGLGMAANMAGIIEMIAQAWLFWLALLMVPFLSLLPDVAAKAGMTTIKPSESDKVRLAQRDNYNPFINKTLDRLKDYKTLLPRKKNSSDRDIPMTLHKPSSRNSGKGFAFSIDEKSQRTVVEMYDPAQSTSSSSGMRPIRYGEADGSSAKTSRDNKADLGM